MTYKIVCQQCDYKQTAKKIEEAKYLRNQHRNEHHHLEVDYERTG